MSSLICSLSGVAPEEPVFSKTGYIFEKRLIEKYLLANAETCPITGEALKIEDLIPVKASKIVKPRPASATSIPGLVSLLQSEWDSLMTETFSLRSNLDLVRNQLTHSLYQHDAACRVIARLLKEKDSLQQELSQLQQQMTRQDNVYGIKSAASCYASEEIGLSDEMLDDLKDFAKSLSVGRKRRNLDGLISPDKLSSVKELGSFSLHSSTKPGVSCCEVDPKHHKHVWTGGCDGLVCLFDLDSEKTLCRLQGHLKKVTQVLAHPTEHITVSSSNDKTVRVWNVQDDTDYRLSYIFRKHTKPVKALSLHPRGSILLTMSRDWTWGLHDLYSGLTYRINRELPCEFTNMSFHPDGFLIGAAGTNKLIYMYDLKETDKVVVSLSGHEDSVTGLEFCQNGYFLATASNDGAVKLWDLRKSMCFETIQLAEHDSALKFVPTKLRFDDSGKYLAVAGTQSGGSQNPESENQLGNPNTNFVTVYYLESKTQLQRCAQLFGHSDSITDVRFGRNTEYMVTSSLDKTLRHWGPQDDAVGPTSQHSASPQG